MKKLLFICLLLSLSTLTGTVAQAQSQSNTCLALEQALEIDEAALQAHLKPNDPLQAHALVMLGIVALDGNDETKASKYFQEALPKISNSCFPKMGRALILAGLGHIEFNQSNYAESQKHLKEAVEIVRTLKQEKDPVIGTYSPWLSDPFGDYADILMVYGKFDEALSLANEGMRLSSECSQCDDVIDQIQNLDQSPDYVKSMDPEIIRWNDETHLITVYLGTGEGIPDWDIQNLELARRALLAWETASNRRFEFKFIDNRDMADVRFEWVLKTEILEGNEIVAQNIYDTVGSKMFGNDIQVSLHHQNGVVIPKERMYAAILHEAGHMLGIRGHSPNPADVMALKSARGEVTARDIATLNAIYQLPANCSNPLGMTLAQYREKRAKKL